MFTVNITTSLIVVALAVAIALYVLGAERRGAATHAPPWQLYPASAILRPGHCLRKEAGETLTHGDMRFGLVPGSHKLEQLYVRLGLHDGLYDPPYQATIWSVRVRDKADILGRVCINAATGALELRRAADNSIYHSVTTPSAQSALVLEPALADMAALWAVNPKSQKWEVVVRFAYMQFE